MIYLGLFIAGIGALAAAFSAFFSYRAVKVTKETQMDLLRPVIVPVSKDPSFTKDWIKFWIKNIGQGPLTNLICSQESLNTDIKSSSLGSGEETEVYISRTAEDELARLGEIILTYKDTYGRNCITSIIPTIKEQGPDHGYKYDFGVPERWACSSTIMRDK